MSSPPVGASILTRRRGPRGGEPSPCRYSGPSAARERAEMRPVVQSPSWPEPLTPSWPSRVNPEPTETQAGHIPCPTGREINAGPGDSWRPCVECAGARIRRQSGRIDPDDESDIVDRRYSRSVEPGSSWCKQKDPSAPVDQHGWGLTEVPSAHLELSGRKGFCQAGKRRGTIGCTSEAFLSGTSIAG